jgi:hypothetical protein
LLLYEDGYMRNFNHDIEDKRKKRELHKISNNKKSINEKH